MSKNPWTAITKPKPKVGERVLSPEEQSKLLAVLKTGSERRWLLFMIATGLRISEIYGMELRPEGSR